jgi:hypothetical protein
MKLNSFKAVKNQIMLWGNNQVVKQTNLLFENLKNDETDAEQLLKKADNIYLEIRRELGYRSYKVDRHII